MTVHPQNWAGNITFSTDRVHRPETVEQVQAVVRQSRKVRVLGSRHSFNDLADSTGDLLALENLAPTWFYDRARQTATVNGGVTYGQLCAWLHGEGAAIHNMASLPHITVAGAIATATHGSGDQNGNLATAVAGLELVTGAGEVIRLSRTEHPEQLAGAVVGLGGLGVVTKVTLDTVPAFMMQQAVYENLPLAQLWAHFDEIMSSAYSVSLFTDWQQERVNSVWIKRKMTDDGAPALAPTFYDAALASRDLHPVVTLPAEPCTPQMGVVGPWHERLPHFRVDHVPASGNELQTEYFVPREHAVAAMQVIVDLQERIAAPSVDFRGADRGRGYAVDESQLWATDRGAAFFVEEGLGSRAPTLAGDRGATCPFPGASPLGQALHHATRAGAGALSQTGRFPRTAAHL